MAEVDALVESPHAGGFIVSEANGNRSRAQGTIEAAVGPLDAGAVLDLDSPGVYIEHVPSTGTAVAILIWGVDALENEVAIIVRDAEVNAAEIVWPAGISGANIALAVIELAAVGIIVRTAV